MGDTRLRASASDRSPIEAFAAEYGHRARSLPPIAIVIAAFNEQEVIGSVVKALPGSVLGLRTAVLVISDGSADSTAAIARASGALVCDMPVNQGQGAALRLGYQLAREGGAEYIVTTDADGQYDPAEISDVIAPILAGNADFVTGSRALGGEETTDPVRRAGVRIFGFLISLLTGQRITDPAFGLRAMRAEVSGAVRLEQAQYQSSELLIAVLAHGFRVREVPATIRKRKAGQSKKGHNALYGLSFARVVARTWWRERRRRSYQPERLLSPARAANGVVPATACAPPTGPAPGERLVGGGPLGRGSLGRGRHRKTAPEVTKRFRRFAVAAVAAVVASQLALTVCLGLLRWTPGTCALAAWLVGAATSYLVSRWAWERRGRPHLLREAVPFWIVALGAAAVLTITTRYADHEAVSMGLNHVQTVLFADAAYFSANVLTFISRFLIFHYVLFADRKRKRAARRDPALGGLSGLDQRSVPAVSEPRNSTYGKVPETCAEYATSGQPTSRKTG